MIVVEELQDTTQAEWDAYVRSSRGGLPTHLSAWREVLSRTHGYQTQFLMAREAGCVVGVMPLFFVRSALVGSSAMTLPGGLCADTDSVAQALVTEAEQLARRRRLQRLMIQDTRQAWPIAAQTVSDHVHWVVDVRGGSEALWTGLHRNIRRQIRIANSYELSVQIDHTSDSLGDFYALFSQFTHQAGTPVFGRRFLDNVVAVFPSEFSIALVRREGQAIGAFFQLEMNDTVHGMWGASLHEYLSLRSNYLLYWEILKDTAQRGFSFLDMGRSPAHSSASDFKGQWGGESRPVFQQVKSLGRVDNAQTVTQRLNSDGKMRLVRQVWPKLPASVAAYLGPKLRRHVPFA